MRFQFLDRWLPGRRGWWLIVALIAALGGLAIGSCWLSEVKQLVASNLGNWRTQPAGDAGHEGYDHGQSTPGEISLSDSEQDHEGEAADAHAGEANEEAKDAHGQAENADHKHEEAAAVKLSETARENVGLKLAKVERRVFERTITTPAMVVERPGRSAMQITAPLTGVVTRIWPLQGATVPPGQPLFDLRLTHEEVVEAQADFLRTAEELDVLKREIARLDEVARGGAIAGKTLLERQYEQQKLEGVFRAQRQRLLLHGLSSTQVDEIVSKRTLLGALTVSVPDQFDDQGKADKAETSRILQIEELTVTKGQYVRAGDPLCVLADYAKLYIQGKAFEQDATALEKAASSDWRLTAVIQGAGKERQMVPELPIVYLANKVEPESRAFLFYVELPNHVVRTQERPDGHRFSSWQFKPGQRVELLVPVERWTDRIVLPLDAVVQDGVETYVFEQNDGHFDRRAVRVEYRDQYSAVIADDGTLQPGKMVVVSGTYQVHLSLKNKSGGAPDPHAGHNH
ncbi:MAG: efflux RND transporter periplasmic adaptor subunit [Pirellulaceae bacterium]|nr:efflux RND transporter periplasmic adaptor subunit [Pirellulaceae bacterium]